VEILLNPKQHVRRYRDERSHAVMRKTIEFFERKGKRRLKEDYHARVWYADFVDFVRREKIFATMCTPAGYGAAEARWDTWRICEFAEILGFYGLQYWYTWQVSVLGLGPIWMSRNEVVKQRTARLLEDGAVFAFGLSEKAHGADIYSTDMVVTPVDEGRYSASGRKYYIGNGNNAAIVSTFGKLASGDYVFFAVDSQHECYECVQNVCGQPELRLGVRLARVPSDRGGHLAQGSRGVGRGAEHRQHRQVQPGLGVDRHLHPRALRGGHPRPQSPALQDARHRLPTRQTDVRRRVRAPGGDEALRAACLRLHARRLARRPALPAL
jgi:hypothetical protein